MVISKKPYLKPVLKAISIWTLHLNICGLLRYCTEENS